MAAQTTGWRSNLPSDGLAKFRGVPFRWRESTLESGKRAVIFEYPLRDIPFTQDLGRLAHRFPLSGYVIQNGNNGLDYFPERDRLIAALEQQDPGTLIHPYFGEITVQVLGFSVKESQQDGGIAYFEMNFVEAGGNASPTATVDTAGTVISAADAVAGAAFSAFTGLKGVQTVSPTSLGLPIGEPASTTPAPGLFSPAGDAVVSDSAVSQVTDLHAQFGDVLQAPGFDLSQVGVSLSALYQSAGSVIDTVGVGLAIYSVINDYTTTVTTPPLTNGTAITANSGSVTVPSGVSPLADSTRLPPSGNILTADPTYGMGVFATWGNDFPPIAGVSASAIQAAANQAALRAYVQALAAASIGRIFAATLFASSTTAQAALALLDLWMDAMIEAAADAGLNQLYFSLSQLASAISVDVNQRAAQLPSIQPYSTSVSFPSEALSQLLYAGASNGQLLVALNDAPHPLFLPINGIALTAA